MKLAAPPRVIAAPDSFKGTFTAPDVAAAMRRGLESAGLQADSCPVADGGEGTIAAVLAAMPGRVVRTKVHDPLGREVDASFAMLDGDRCALVETAAAVGLGLLPPAERDPWLASSFGAGELIRVAARSGAERVLVGVGGSATVDGGSGALQALIDLPRDGAQIVVLCDVTTPWERCAQVYGPQKGADPRLVERLARRLDDRARTLPRDPRGVRGSGAGGGLAGALWAALDARLHPGASYVLDTVGFNRRLTAADAVICGEGKLDAQSAEGKIVSEVAWRARSRRVPIHAIVGRRHLGEAGREALGITSIQEATTLLQIERAANRLGRRLFPTAAGHPDLA